MLSFVEQQSIVGEIRSRIDEVDQHETLLELMGRLRARSDVAQSTAQQLVELMRSMPVRSMRSWKLEARR